MDAWEQLKIYIEVMPINNRFILRHINSKPFDIKNNIEIGEEIWSQIIVSQDLN